MHQEHTIPWNSLASNFKFIRENKAYTPRRTALYAQNLPTQPQKLNHFLRVLHSTITTFSETERAKYDTHFEAPTTGTIFSDELRDRYPEYLNEKYQSIEYWIAANRNDTGRTGNFADVIKVLISENQMETLLMLAHHPQISLITLRNLSWGHHFGFSRVMEESLWAYTLLNLCAASNILESGAYLEMEEYKWMIYELTGPMDFPAQQVPHRAYLDPLPKDPKTGLPEVHRDFAGLKEYMKTLFCLMYRYDMLVKECGHNPGWEEEIMGLFGHRLGIGVKVEHVEVDGSWVQQFA